MIRRGLVHTRFVDRRANRLEELVIREGSEGGFECAAAGPREAAELLERALEPCGARRLERADGLGRDYTDVWRLSREPDAQLRDGLRFMGSVLYLCARAPVDGAVALDWYKQPDESGELVDTPAGSMLHVAKYNGVSQARRDLAHALAEILRRHPAYRVASTILSVPGSSPTSTFSRALASGVAEATGLSLVHGRAYHQTRPPAKEQGDDAPEDELRELYYVDEPLDGQTICIVDDVVRRGRTMRAMAYAAKGAGAARCLGLAGARTLRSVA